MIDEIFDSAGLTKEQAAVYSQLLVSQGLEAAKVSYKTGLERTFVYKILTQLINIGLAEKIDKPKSVSIFQAMSPSRIKELVDNKAKEALAAQSLVAEKIGLLISEHNLNNFKPNIVFIEGVDGIKKITDDVLKEREIKIIRSHLDKQRKETAEVIEDQISKRLSLGMTTKVIGPLPAGSETDITKLKENDKARLVTRGIISGFEIPAQVIIYGNKVAITDYKDGMITTIIDNPNVKETFEKIFDFMFEKAGKLS